MKLISVLTEINETKSICEQLMSARDYKIVEKYIDWLKDHLNHTFKDE